MKIRGLCIIISPVWLFITRAPQMMTRQGE